MVQRPPRPLPASTACRCTNSRLNTAMPPKLVAVSLALALSVNAALAERIRGQATADYSRQSNVAYGRASGVALTMEVLTPAKPNGNGAVWISSSNGVSNREQTLSPSFERRVTPLLNHGYTVFAVIHRSSPDFQVPDYVADARRAVRFIRHNASAYRIDGTRLAIAGSSSGGLIALTIAMTGDDGNATASDPVERESSRVRAAASFFPPTDLMNFGETTENAVDWMQKQMGKVDPGFQFRDVDAKTGVRTLITDRSRVLAILREVSPVTHVSADDPSILLIHGDADKAVPLRQSRLLMDRLNAAKVTARLVVREGKGHAYQGWEADSELIANWFDEHVRGNQGAKPPGLEASDGRGILLHVMGGSPYYQAVDEQQHKRTGDRHQHAGTFTGAIEAKRAAQVPADQCARNAEQDRDDETTRVLPRHDQFGDDACDQTEQNPSKNAH